MVPACLSVDMLVLVYVWVCVICACTVAPKSIFKISVVESGTKK